MWALSLAHGQLAEVFFDMALAGFIKDSNAIGGIGVDLLHYFIFVKKDDHCFSDIRYDYRRRSFIDGRNGMFPARSEIALGGILE